MNALSPEKLKGQIVVILQAKYKKLPSKTQKAIAECDKTSTSAMAFIFWDNSHIN